MYEIASHWNATSSNSHGDTFDSVDEAFAALVARYSWHFGSDMVEVPFDGEHGTEYVIYASKEDADRNGEGLAPHLAIAVIRKAVK